MVSETCMFEANYPSSSPCPCFAAPCQAFLCRFPNKAAVARRLWIRIKLAPPPLPYFLSFFLHARLPCLPLPARLPVFFPPSLPRYEIFPHKLRSLARSLAWHLPLSIPPGPRRPPSFLPRRRRCLFCVFLCPSLTSVLILWFTFPYSSHKCQIQV